MLFTGIFTYIKYNSIIKNIKTTSYNNIKTITIRSATDNLEQAEYNLKSFVSENKQQYLQEYNTFKSLAKKELQQLLEIKNTEETSNPVTDSLIAVINEKLKLLEEIYSYNQKSVERPQQEVIKKIESRINNVKQTTKDSGFFNWFRNNKNKQAWISISELNKELNDLKKENAYINNKQRKAELELLLKGKNVDSKLNKLLKAFEKEERNRIKQEIDNAAIATNEGNNIIALFCFAIGVSLLLMTYFTIRHFNSMNAIRKALATSKIEAEELAKTKERLIANMSHEFRTPLHAIIGFTNQLNETEKNEGQQEFIDIILKSSEQLNFLINDFLDFSKLQQNKLVLESIHFNIRDLLEQVVKMFEPKLRKKNLSCHLTVHEDIPEFLQGDPYRLRQILLNLISNSIKFTNVGSIEINADINSSRDDIFRIEFTINDTGIGMKTEQLKKVFLEFEQGSADNTRLYGGTGLGLSITKMLVNLFNGEISLTSDPGAGTQAQFTIPFKKGNKIKAPLHILKQPKVSFRENLRILVVDDEKYNRKLLRKIVEKYKSEITEAENGIEAIEAVANGDFDIILMDARMPKLNGIEATEIIRGKHNIKTPIIALTAAVTKEDRTLYNKVGMNDVLAKPFNEEDLVSIINKYTELSNTPQNNENKKSSNEESELINFQTLKEMCAGDEAFYKEMLEIFIDSTIQGFIEIDSYAEEQNWQMIGELAHKMCSPCKHLNTKKFYKKLKMLENETKSSNISNKEVILNLILEAKQLSQKIIPIVQEELKKL